MKTATQILFAQLASRVIQPTLAFLELGDDARALNLLLGTAAQETGFSYLAQWPTGPALGIYQIEPATHQSLLANFVAYRPTLKAKLDALAAPGPGRDQQLATNLAYASAIVRIRYLDAPGSLPAASDVAGMGAYWKAHYNTAGGGGDVDAFVRNFALHIGDPLNA